MIVGYARVSSQDQNLDLQRDALKAAGCERIFEEHVSGAKAQRPQFASAMDFLRPGDTLVVWKLDRLARSMRQLIDTVALLDSRSVGLRSLTESIDTGTANGRFFFHVFGALAEFERSILRERTLAGLEAARQRGRTGGRPRAMSEAAVRKARALLRDETLTIAEVAETLKVSRSTLYKYVPAARSSVTEGGSGK